MTSSARTIQDTLLTIFFAYALDAKMKATVGVALARSFAGEARSAELLVEQSSRSGTELPGHIPMAGTALADTWSIPDMLLERYLASALDEGERALLDDLLEKSPLDRARLGTLRADSEAFLLEHPPGLALANFQKARARYALSEQERALLEEDEIQEALSEYEDGESIVLDLRATDRVHCTKHATALLGRWFNNTGGLLAELRGHLARFTNSMPSVVPGWTKLTREDRNLFVKLVPLPLSTGRLLWALVLQEFAQTPSHKVGLEGTAEQLLTALLQQMGAESIVLDPPGREVMRTKQATALLEAWFKPEELQEGGVPRVLLEALFRFERSAQPLDPQSNTWVREGRDRSLKVTFVALPEAAGERLWALLLQEVEHSVPVPTAWRSLLTQRETEVAAGVLQGWDNTLIAEHLGIAVSTVKSHMHHIFDKLGVDSREALIVKATRR